MAFSATAKASATNTDETVILAAQGAGTCINLTHITLSNSSAITPCTVSLKAGGTAFWEGINLAANDTVSICLQHPVRLDSNVGVSFQTSASVSTIYANIGYFIHPNG